jgi:hypothetical protein
MTTLQAISEPFRSRLTITKIHLPLALAAAFATIGAAPALAKYHHRYHHRVVHHRTLRLQATDDPGEFHSTPERDAALRTCNAQAQKYSESAWETTKFAVYGTCMTEHGQMP